MFGNDSWVADTVRSVNDDDAFAAASAQFDGSVALLVGDRTVWLKLYRGEIIDTEPYVPQFGATFQLIGDIEAWQRLAAGDHSLSRALYEARIRMEGNKLEANRLRDAVELFVRHLQAVTPDDPTRMEADA